MSAVAVSKIFWAKLLIMTVINIEDLDEVFP